MVLVLALVTLTSLAISVIDGKSHRIPNPLTALLAFLLLLDSHHSSFLLSLSYIAITVVIGYLGKVGAGDVKLFIALLLTSTSIILTSQYFLGVALISGATVLISLLATGFRATAIPFAPALLLPFLAIYLGI
jgi:Flp pilus assembly protein protease CpaA